MAAGGGTVAPNQEEAYRRGLSPPQPLKTHFENQSEARDVFESAAILEHGCWIEIVRGPLRSTSLDVHHQDWRFWLEGEAGDWGAPGGSKEARFTLRHIERGENVPTFQVESWGRITDSQLRGSMAVNPELSSSFALIVQGNSAPTGKELVLNVAHNVPRMLVYLPSQFGLRSQLNQSQSSGAAMLEVLSGRRKLWAVGELAATEGGYRQALEVKHSWPQLKPFPRIMAVRTSYELQRWSYALQQATVWGNDQFSLSALCCSPPGLEGGNHTLKVQISGVPRSTSMEVLHDRSLHGNLDRISLGWKRNGQTEKVQLLRSWSQSEDFKETNLELKHPFCSALSQLSLRILSPGLRRKRSSRHQTHLSWNGAVPVNISLSLNKLNSNAGRACVLLSARRTSVSSGRGCVSVGHGGNLYSQTADVTWHNKSFRQGMTYQKSNQGLHGLQIYIDLDRVSPGPCHSHMFLAKVQTNLRDRLEHRVEVGICPEQPISWWSGSHRVNSGDELFSTRSNLSVTGRQSSFTLVLSNSSTAEGTNVSLSTESMVGNWSLGLVGSALSWTSGSGLQVQAAIDGRQKIWLNGTIEGRCLRTTAGYINGSDLCEDLSAVACAGFNHSLRADVQRREGCRESETLGSLSLEKDNQRLILTAEGRVERLTAAEEQLDFLSSQIKKHLIEKIKPLQHLLTEMLKQPSDHQLLQQRSSLPVLVSRQTKAPLGRGDTGLLSLWLRSSLRRALTSSLPDLLGRLHQASLLGQQELRRPLATLAGVYQDVKGQRLEAAWREAVGIWTDRLMDVLHAELENPHLRLLSVAGLSALRAALDAAGQQTYHWVDTRLAMALSGVRKRLASFFKFTPREGVVSVSLPLLNLNLSRVAEVGPLKVVLEEWLLRPLLALASIRPSAELYRLKRKIMDGPFRRKLVMCQHVHVRHSFQVGL
ncbi:PREDICTED: uncharacterized protein LOC107104429 [Cyprinodon variegatus]|uniref:uncharacterized protein LOC107104429 n=1 Tax=Cyprinodon variegatus TaxID=28743 RepID=UPI000742BF59|nr:PREDICTED: uncharacterized protein LOC107104429 [Cyprinodon variegatus]